MAFFAVHFINHHILRSYFTCSDSLENFFDKVRRVRLYNDMRILLACSINEDTC